MSFRTLPPRPSCVSAVAGRRMPVLQLIGRSAGWQPRQCVGSRRPAEPAHSSTNPAPVLLSWLVNRTRQNVNQSAFLTCGPDGFPESMLRAGSYEL